MSKTEIKSTVLSLDEYLDLIYPVTLFAEPEGGYTAMIQDLPGCMTQGETLQEAMDNIEDARKLWIATAYEFGDAISTPTEIARWK